MQFAAATPQRVKASGRHGWLGLPCWMSPPFVVPHTGNIQGLKPNHWTCVAVTHTGIQGPIYTYSHTYTPPDGCNSIANQVNVFIPLVCFWSLSSCYCGSCYRAAHLCENVWCLTPTSSSQERLSFSSSPLHLLHFPAPSFSLEQGIYSTVAIAMKNG